MSEQTITGTITREGITFEVEAGSGGGTTVHNLLSGRDAAEAHPAAAIDVDGTPLDQFLDGLPTGGADLSDATPQALGTAAAGVSTEASRADHVHAMPSAADVGADPAGSAAAVTTTSIGAVPTSRTITAGTGLSGGGDLTANRTLSVSFGTTSGTAAQGNDARLSDARTPTAHKTSHATGGSDALTASDIGAAKAWGIGTPTAYTGGFHLPPGRIQVPDASVLTFTSGTMYYLLGFCPFAWKITAARSRITSAAAGASLRRLILSCDSAQMPSAVIWQETVDASSTGAKDTTGLSVTVPAGPFLIGARAEGGTVGAVGVGQYSQFMRSNMVAGESTPADGTLKASTGTGTVTTPPVPDTLWASTVGSIVSFRWEVA